MNFKTLVLVWLERLIQLRFIVPTIYATLVLLSVIVVIDTQDPWGALYAILFTLPWSLLFDATIHSLSKNIIQHQSLAFGMSLEITLYVIYGLINIAILYFLFRSVDKEIKKYWGRT